MRNSFYKLKSLTFLAALTLVACSGHKVGDPTEKYGDLQRLATDSTMRATQDPTRAPRVDIETDEMPARGSEGSTLSFQVRVRMEAGFEDVQHDLQVNSNNKGVSLQAHLEKVTGGLTYWNVTGRIVEDLLLQKEEFAVVDVQFDVIFQPPADAQKAAALKGSQPSETRTIIIKRVARRAEILDVRASKNRYETGSSVSLDIVVDSKGSDPEELTWTKRVLIKGCDAAVANCDLSDLLIIGEFEASNKNWMSTATLDLPRWQMDEGEERDIQIDLTLTSPSGEADSKTKAISVFRRADLKAPEVAPLEYLEEPMSVALGEDFEVGLIVSLANEVGSLEINKEALKRSMGEGWIGNVNCTASSETAEECTLSGHFSCDAPLGPRDVKLVFAAVEDQKSLETPFNMYFEVLQGEACHE